MSWFWSDGRPHAEFAVSLFHQFEETLCGRNGLRNWGKQGTNGAPGPRMFVLSHFKLNESQLSCKPLPVSYGPLSKF